MGHLEPLMQRNFLEYASYVIVDRAIPDLRDGCKPVQRRLLHTLYLAEDGKFHKVANIIGETMKLHPHGDASIGEALVVLANKEYFIEKQGNYGNVVTGHAAAAARYIECRLTALARDTLFNPALTKTQASYDGRREEPVVLPAKLPVILMLGTEGIAVGMATKILPHNFCELLEAQIALLGGKATTLYPDFLQGGAIDVRDYADGRGKIRVRATLEPLGDKKVVIREIPYSTTTEGLIASIEAAIQRGKVKISSIDDFTTDRVEIELTLARGIYADEVIPQLYAYTDCEVSISSNIVAIRDRHPVELGVSEVLAAQTTQLRGIVGAELEYELTKLQDRQHWLTLEQIFVEQRIYRRIEAAKTAEAVADTVRAGMAPHAERFVRPLSDEDIGRLLELRIRRISAFDIAKNQADIAEVESAIRSCRQRLKHLTRTTVSYLERLLKAHGRRYPRRTKITTFDVIDRKAVARQDIRLGYDPESGFLGTDVRGPEHPLTVSEYDLVLAVNQAGAFRVMTLPAKVLVGKLLHLAVLRPEDGAPFTVVYRDKDGHCFAKKITIAKFVRNREYRLVADPAGHVDLLLPGHAGGQVVVTAAGRRRGVPKEMTVDLRPLAETGLQARGTRLVSYPVAKVRPR